MIERFFRRPHVRCRLAQGPLASLVPVYLDHLATRGYGKTTIQQYVAGVEHFGRWLGRTGGAIDDIDVGRITAFLTRHLPRCRCPTPCSRTVHGLRAALRQLLAIVPREAPDAIAPLVPGSIDAVLHAFERHLTDTCGTMPATRRYYLRETRAFLRDTFRRGPVKLAAVRLADVHAFVTTRAATLQPASANVVATALRSFVRFLQLQGVASAAWVTAVPRAADWRLARLPRVLTDTEVRAFLAAFDRATPHGRRDYAMALCLLELGLRAGDVAQLSLDALDWRVGTLTLAPGKGRRCSCLPLPSRVAAAVADYLRHGRPRTAVRAVFVQHRPPRGNAIEVSGVRCAMRLAYARAQLDPRPTGTHILRHTMATRLLRQGVSMKAIADVLRHRSLDTSAIYAKVDLPMLATVALPWPGRRS